MTDKTKLRERASFYIEIDMKKSYNFKSSPIFYLLPVLKLSLL